MNEENKIEIVSDDSNVISFNDITIKHDTIDRNEVAEVENAITKLEEENADYANKISANNDSINILKEKLEYAKKVIALADAKKLETQEEENLAETNVEDGEV